MKNRLEAELVSIAHRILKLKNKSETIQLQQESLNLYQKLSVLRFIEENYDDVSVVIPSDIQDRIEQPTRVESTDAAPEVIKEKEEEVLEEKTISKQETIASELEDVEVSEVVQEEKIAEDTPLDKKQVIDFEFDANFKEFESQLSNAKPVPAPSIFDQLPEESSAVAESKETLEAITRETESLFEPKKVSINDAVRKNFNIGLNDKVAFEFHLFGGKSQDFNRVLSQLQTFESFSEANDFIQNVVKPDYNNWLSKDEYENRFLEVIENKFL
ncbi:MAG TPA: hypothetical protein VLZ11_06670 [Flavobacterium sp.]|nr:hypothetical protein [Flavobacterium sp.]